MKKLLSKVKECMVQEFLWMLPKKCALKLAYYRRFHNFPNLDNPIIFNEKLQYLILHSYGQNIADCADKIKVRKYLEKKGYTSDSFAKLHGVYKKAEDIDYDTLPDAFVLKTNNGCHMNILCRDKHDLDIKETNRILNRWLNTNYAKKYLEYHYALIPPRILCEELLVTENGEGDIIDYKIHCINGIPVGILVCTERTQGLRLNWYDLEWKERKDYIVESYRGDQEIRKPVHLSKMMQIAENIADDFDFVRVDLYEIGDRVLFSELTFTPEAGRIRYFTQSVQEELGRKLVLSDFNAYR